MNVTDSQVVSVFESKGKLLSVGQVLPVAGTAYEHTRSTSSPGAAADIALLLGTPDGAALLGLRTFKGARRRPEHFSAARCALGTALKALAASSVVRGGCVGRGVG